MSSNLSTSPCYQGDGLKERADSNDIVIRVSNLSKCYQIYEAPRDRLKQFILPRLSRLAGRAPKQYFREFWALTDVSFEIRKGETVGIIGRNGSGKSTLLQMICGTLNPTSGVIQTNGRIAALLELGSGFNPEFTGRENVYMNASVLGLSNEEVDTRFNDIVAFADIGDFIEQPVKTYSSGMMVRLAFAVIAHVDADILVVDEALAVGDAFFTQKCMRFLRGFMENGTVLFVSHDSGSVKNLCTSAIWLEKGHQRLNGSPEEVCNAYLEKSLQDVYGEKFTLGKIGDQPREILAAHKTIKNKTIIDYKTKALSNGNLLLATGWKTGMAEVVSVSMVKVENSTSPEFEGGERVRVVIRAKAIGALSSPILGFILKDRLGQELFGENTVPATHGGHSLVGAGQEFEAEFVFRLPMLQNGEYMMMVSLADGDTLNHVQHHYLHDAMLITVYSSKIKFGIVGIPFEFVSLAIDSGPAFSIGSREPTVNK
ncbi:teichoic acids export ATP-binding protein TagH [mine drainage metagenome]|uniref:Teichoic acids export ATP-binding protein TagH n=1 Tax=mine drainage metagenome TaxID=410659 RepID=A0A1J5SQD6_9ZZZZ